MSAPAATNGKLALDPRDVELTLQPVERATMLPPAAFADESVLAWEIDNIFNGWICMGHVSAVAEQGDFLMREIGDTSVFAMTGEDGVPRLPERLPPSRRPPRRGDRGSGPPPHPVPLPRLVIRPRRQARGRPAHERGRGLRPACWGLLEVRSAVVGGLLLIDLSGEAPDPAEHVGDLLESLDRYRVPELQQAPAAPSTRSRRTGRASPRTTTSACTVPASTRS